MLYLRPSRLLPELPLAKGDGRYACIWGSQKHQWATYLLTGCKFQVPQNARRLINVYAINFMP